ncbi:MULTISPECIES: bifunctional 5,10-methylenetetrahydrofolate dehydrogenase/5,10-methenyltetrahydrofolate cyclohydrolase [Pseudonocardia]|uniref:Bifunctional protein FolD n=2 Tax=Pseudonocardia TaxID=1847 RepID=A0A1Y2MWH3_PSEAH|nr:MULTISPECIES: tetrahydrofolate dehydrogenase/cyclohydrolase catalytic domain-containing protein [Pseudonocardia]OSY39512.1 Bifunctional protein FolD protein [Pseudonocardia autotrophica]TDN75250.1 methylenetetrahydrofolate dehydrogenase (NADP+)/methenyltetrahydrofolate cyclohydrolase [Pseudonocardia autotrophica]BBF99195.1 bifunctional protein FolD [Pseudonocardia autotrophica]GEC24741.1 bifunctional protein FolD [Pseudonocardia saturnea]
MSLSPSPARMLPGAPVAEAVLASVQSRAQTLQERGVTPSLATILVGDDDASAGYIRIKQRQAAALGFLSPHVHLPADTTQQQLHDAIRAFNDDPDVHGVLVQYPIPAHLDYGAALAVVDPDKDVDGMHPMNLGRLAAGMPAPKPCTPAGIEALLDHYDIPVRGRHVVVLGRGATLGRPLSILLSQKRETADAAVTVVHTGVPDWSTHTRAADILVAAAGVPGIIRPEHIRPGGVVIGGGVRYEGRRLLPDVDESCNETAGAITPRVGGVGPTTVAMLFRNTVDAAELMAARA